LRYVLAKPDLAGSEMGHGLREVRTLLDELVHPLPADLQKFSDLSDSH
jgi:hypothetical protein